MIKVINKNCDILKYIRKHKKVKGVTKEIVDFYTEYKIERQKQNDR